MGSCMVRASKFQSTLPSRGATGSKPAASRSWAFQSTLPSRGATSTYQDRLILGFISIHAPLAGSDTAEELVNSGLWISIHAPLAGSDILGRCTSDSFCNFNPRSPRGERLLGSGLHGELFGFQSTLPSRGATSWGGAQVTVFVISIHAPLAGSDYPARFHRARRPNFNPRSPRGERPV